KALESSSQAFRSSDAGWQGKRHSNLGKTPYECGETQKSNDKKPCNWTNAPRHYQHSPTLEPQTKEANCNSHEAKSNNNRRKNNKGQSGEDDQPSPSPGDHGNDMPSPSPSPGSGEGAEENPTPSATPTESPQKKLAGEVKGAGKDESKKTPDKNAQIAEAESE